MNLHDHQQEFINEIREALKLNRSVLGVASVGFGKTVTSSYIARETSSKGKRVIFLVHRDNLVTQTSATFRQFGIDHGFITANQAYDARKLVHIASVQTLARRLSVAVAPNVLIVDECHLAASKSFSSVINWAKQAGALVIGNSGSPIRLDGKPLGDLFDTMVEARPMSWLINQGYLSEYRYFAPTVPDFKGVKKSMGDFNTAESVEITDTPTITGDAVTHWKKYASNMRTICFCITIEHAEHVASAFNEAGVSACAVSVKSTSEERKRAFQGLADGDIKIICNVELVTTGFDLSAQAGRDVPVECVIMLRPTQSTALYIQMVGRALRKKPYHAVILDHVGNSTRHGLPDDDREWSLDGKKQGSKKSETQAPITCESCFNQVRYPAPDKCPHCGAMLKKAPKPAEITHDYDAELYEITREQKNELARIRKEEEKNARTIEELIALGVARGYRYPSAWATYKFNARRSVR